MAAMPGPGSDRAIRLEPAEIEQIRNSAARHFGPGVRVWLFGSRTDPGRRGGDIDLYLEPDQDFPDTLEREMRMYADLQIALGEQRIDLVVRRLDAPERPIDRAARQTGVRL